MNFKRTVQLRSKLEKDKIIKRLSNVTTPYNKENPKYKFEGKIEDDHFIVRQLFNYGQNNQIRPEIKGEIKDMDSFREITLNFYLPSEMKSLLIFTFIANLIIGVLNLLYEFIKIPCASILHFGAMAIFYVLLVLFYEAKVDDCKNEFKLLSNGVIK